MQLNNVKNCSLVLTLMFKNDFNFGSNMKCTHSYRLPRLRTRISKHWTMLYFISLCFSVLLLPYCATLQLDAEPETYYDSEQLCQGEWKYPLKCDTFDCDYKATWEYRDEVDEIIFTISTKNRNKWTGIGFTDNQAMPETDAILGLVEESGRFFLMDSWLQAYEAPPLDMVQNLHNQTAWRENGLTTLRFSRFRQTGDSRDYQFSDNNCPYFVFPVMGGVFNAVNKRIRKHESTPVVSDRRICIRSCRQPSSTSSTTSTSKPTTTTTVIPPQAPSTNANKNQATGGRDIHDQTGVDESTKVYRVELKLPRFLGSQAKQVNSEPYQELLATLEENVYHELKPQFDRIRRVEVSEIITDENANKNNGGGNGNGDVLAILDLTVGQKSKENKDDVHTLTIALSSLIRDSALGEITVDPNYLVVARKDSPSKLTAWLNSVFGSYYRFSEDEQKWIIIGVGISALVLLALIQACCMFCRCRTNTVRQHEDYLDEKDVVDKQWKECNQDSYHNGYSGYGLDEYNGGGGDYGHSNSTTGTRSNSLHKNYRGYAGEGRVQHYHHNEGGPYHPSLDRRAQYEHHQQSSRRGQPGPYEINERHGGGGGSGKYVQQSYMEQLRPDFYFMPHQRKYSTDVVRVFVDYDGN